MIDVAQDRLIANLISAGDAMQSYWGDSLQDVMDGRIRAAIYGRSGGGGSSSYGGDYGANQRYINGCQQLLNQQQQVYNSWNAGMQSSANWHRINYGY